MAVVPASTLAPLPEVEPFGFSEPGASAAASRPRCSTFAEEGRRISLVLLGDNHFQRRYEAQIQSLRCFSDRHGYDFKILTGGEFEVCRQYFDYFFKKHCTVAEWLESQPASLVAAIVDADVAAAVLERGLEKWANHPSDVQLYQRCLLPEVMAGNYMVRNTAFARNFLRKWASYNFEMPKGYSSSDNGAIHLVLQEMVQVEGFERCKRMYKALETPVTELDPYFAFVKCVLDRLGPPRDWRSKGGVVTVWPRLNFWAADGVYMGMSGSREVGPVLHHGIKDKNDVLGKYYFNLSRCEGATTLLKDATKMGVHAIDVAHAYKDYFAQGKACKGTAARQCPDNCLRSFNCWPLDDQEPPLVRRTCSSRGC